VVVLDIRVVVDRSLMGHRQKLRRGKAPAAALAGFKRMPADHLFADGDGPHVLIIFDVDDLGRADVGAVPHPMQRPSTGAIRRNRRGFKLERPGADHFLADALAQQAADAPVRGRVGADPEIPASRMSRSDWGACLSRARMAFSRAA